jgi:hypothetical protein
MERSCDEIAAGSHKLVERFETRRIQKIGLWRLYVWIRRVNRWKRRLHVCDSAVILEVWFEDFRCNIWVIWVLVSVLKSVARRRPVETDNPSACAAVKCKLYKSKIALCCLHLSLIKRECVTEVLINPIIRTRTCHFVTRTTLHVIVLFKVTQQRWIWSYQDGWSSRQLMSP